ncbi:MAG TPA: cyclic pyranopterin monophosphate synthase MoaC [Phycisphaerae bacterium]|jgi:cyclic pyranopterin phosphate synthase|nr:cyclic pyranopterin monophosphate synthase MoaC [Phycisphaerae bacterium]
MANSLSHLSPTGEAHMVDVSAKSPTLRRAKAEAFLLLAPATLRALKNNTGPKGEALSVARIAGIQAAKRTGDLIPLCHPLPVEQVTVDFEILPDRVRILATATITAKTGIEMEALTAVAIAGLTLIDMLKAIDPAMQITGIRLLEKTGGKSDYRAAPAN